MYICVYENKYYLVHMYVLHTYICTSCIAYVFLRVSLLTSQYQIIITIKPHQGQYMSLLNIQTYISTFVGYNKYISEYLNPIVSRRLPSVGWPLIVNRYALTYDHKFSFQQL